MSVIEMPARLLGAVATFACKDEGRPNLNGVLVAKDEIVACDGHRLVRVDTRVGPFEGSSIDEDHAPCLIQLEVALAVVAAAKAAHCDRVRVICTDQVLRIEVCAFGRPLFVVETKVSAVKYPPVDTIMIATRDGEPPSIIFDPRLLEGIAPVVDACGASGLEIVGWGCELSPMQFAASGVRFVVMPMRCR